MAFPKKIDYENEIKPLFFAGITLPEIAKSSGIGYHALRKYAIRHNWPEEYKRSKDLLKNRQIEVSSRNVSSGQNLPSRCINGTQIAANVLTSRKRAYQETLSKVIEKAAHLLSKEEMETLSDASAAFKKFAPVHEVAKDIHGLAKDASTPQFEINFLSKISLDDIPEADAKVIESDKSESQ